MHSFVVPHHGSVAHDIEPILALHPKRAIVTVNPRNPYGHPAPSILLRLIEELGRENVLFTGSVSNIKVDRNGVVEALFTAEHRDSYALFVEPSRERLVRRGRNPKPEVEEQYAKLREIMLPAIGGGQDPGGPGESPKDPRPATPRGPRSPLTGDMADPVTRERLVTQGSLLSPEFELVYVNGGGATAADVGKHQVFAPVGREQSPHVLYVTGDVSSATEGAARVRQRELTDRGRIRQVSPDASGGIEVRIESGGGVLNGLEPPRSMPKTRTGKGEPPGGMVYLTGSKMFTSGAATSLIGARVDRCGAVVCLRSADGTYITPLIVGPVFAEVWSRVYDRGIDAFYLSINPTKDYLRNQTLELEHVPADQLRFGYERVAGETAANEVVTAGDIERSRIGRILWEADVLFKSAGLGRDVLRALVPGETASPPDLAGGSLESGTENDLELERKDRWCRLYWTSGSQELSVDQAAHTVRFKGDAVKAEAEPMALIEGQLQTVRGGWCADSRALAKRLQRRANAPLPGDKRLAELKQVAEAQSFIRWMRDNGLSPTEALRDAIAEIPPDNRLQVPRWTSGIRSDTPVVVQEERYVAAGTVNHYVHLSYADPDTLTECAFPEWDTRLADFPKAGYTYDAQEKRWTREDSAFSLEESGFLRRWMSGLSQRIARCAPAVVLPANGVIQVEAESPSGRSRFGIVPHLQPTYYHGGVLLGPPTSQTFLERAWKREGALRQLDGRPLLQRSGDSLHFWDAVGNLQDGSKEGAQHVVFQRAKIVDAFAMDGRLRFLVEAEAAGVVRRELRAAAVLDHAQGLEWTSTQLVVDGGLIFSKAVAPCGVAGAIDCVVAAPWTEADMRAALAEQPALWSAIRMARIAPSVWLVDLDVMAIGEELNRRWNALDSTDPAAALALLRAFGHWGFDSYVGSRATDLVARIAGDTEDPTLGGVLPSEERHQLEKMMALIVDLRLANVSNQYEEGELSGPAVLEQLHAEEKTIALLAPDTAALPWSLMARTAASVAEGGDIQVRVSAGEAYHRYEGMAVRARALGLGDTKPLSMDADDESLDDEEEIEEEEAKPPKPPQWQR
jgi:hypothetical protein